jgi:hypothetical protein
MTEATVSAPLMKKLREKLPGSVVFKHADLGLKGLPDCSVTWKGLTLWLEFKLMDSAVINGDWGPWGYGSLVKAIQVRLSKAPVQRATCQALHRAGHCFYVFWLRKPKIIVLYDPVTPVVIGYVSSTDEACEWIKRYLEAANPHPVVRLL